MAKRKWVTVRAPEPHDLEHLWRLLRAAGGRAELIKWIDKYPAPKMGRPRIDFFKGFVEAQAETYQHAWNIDRASFKAALKARGIKPPKGGFKFLTPTSTIRAYVQAVWDSHEKRSRDESLSPQEREASSTKHLGRSVDAITRRLTKELREKGL
jgi:hypothetical protein